MYYVERSDGTGDYLATWKEKVPFSIFNPLAMGRRRFKQRASTFDEACRVQAEAKAAARRRGSAVGSSEDLGERYAALKWFEYWVRR